MWLVVERRAGAKEKSKPEIPEKNGAGGSRLAVSDGVAQAHASCKTVENASPQSSLTPCILDDDPGQLEMMSAQIAEMGYEAVATADPQEALRLVRSGRCRLVLADVLMPEMDGYEFLDQ